MKRRKHNKKYVLISTICFLSILLLYFILTNNTYLDNLKGLSASIFNKSTKNSKEIDKSEINELRNEIEELKKINKIDSVLTDKIVINASVTKRSTPYWHNIITINKGKKDNVKKGYAVINDGGLVGEVIIVNNKSSEVKLITNQDNNYISAKFNYKDKDYYGIINKYDVIKNELYLENVIGDLDNKIINLNVVTSGLSSNMPSGLYIGKIKELKKDKYNLSNIIIIKIGADINDLNLVKVVGNND
ncbi:MAG: rod shape-determining protein MreC [Bacilli bacterium]|nr:rod shape-determining protein MreC [Bacilli bacterium]